VSDGRAVVLAGLKGGVGKTTVCLNLAASLVSLERSVVAVDADIATPGLADTLQLDVSNRPTLDDVFAGEATAFDAVATTAHGYDVLPVSDPRLAAAGDVDRLPRLVEVLQHRYDLVLVDSPPAMGYGASQAFGAADEAVLVTTPRLPAVHNVKRTEGITRRYDVRSCGIVVNRVGPGNHPSAERIADYVGTALLGAIPDDDAIPLATDAGEPVVVHRPDSDVSKRFRDVAAAFSASARRT
jgi:MinD-like ATPase involved in chromosome partitioning or flagellar assembly